MHSETFQVYYPCCFSWIITFPLEIISPPGHSRERGSMGQPTQCLTTFKIPKLTSTALKPGKPQADIKLWQHAFTDHSSRVRPTVRLEGGLFKFCCNFIVSFQIIIIDPVCITKLYIPQSESLSFPSSLCDWEVHWIRYEDSLHIELWPWNNKGKGESQMIL